MRNMSPAEAHALVLSAIFMEDFLSEIFFLKGGTALARHNVSGRFSEDIDISLPIDSEYTDEELNDKLHNTLDRYFEEIGFNVTDYTFRSKPRNQAPGREDWGGYEIKFLFLPKDVKIPERAHYYHFKNMTGLHDIRIDLSKNEFCVGETHDIDGISIQIYTLEAIVIEKLRAICQQSDRYALITKKKPRAQDLIDIYNCNLYFNGKLKELLDGKLDVVRNIFDAKKVPIVILEDISVMSELLYRKFPAKYEALPLPERQGMDVKTLFNVTLEYVSDLANHLYKNIKDF